MQAVSFGAVVHLLVVWLRLRRQISEVVADCSVRRQELRRRFTRPPMQFSMLGFAYGDQMIRVTAASILTGVMKIKAQRYRPIDSFP